MSETLYNESLNSKEVKILPKNRASSKREKLEGSIIGNFKVLRYVGDKQYECECQCENKTIEVLYTSSLKKSNNACCKKCRAKASSESQRKHLEGTVIHNWKYLEYVGKSKYKCECLLCHNVYIVDSREITRGKTKCCKACSGCALKDLTGQVFGNYKAIEYIGNHYWKCECLKCGDIKEVISQHLTLDGVSQCKKCSNVERSNKVLEESISKLLNKQFNNLIVKGYNYNTGKYICECQCKNKTKIEVLRSGLLSGNTKSCGCISQEMRIKTMISRYGDIATKRINNPRSIDDINDLMNKDRFIARYLELKNRICRVPNSLDISNEFDITTPIALKYAHMYGVEVDIDTGNCSRAENEIIDFIKSIDNNIELILHNRSILQGQELDIYIPEKKIAIEFNGTYWHSSIYLDKNYHQQKTIECAKQGIHLIHIFEHEWHNLSTREKLQDLIYNSLCSNRIKIRATNTDICLVDRDEASKFLCKYHLQNDARANIRIGLKYNKELVALMTFDKPRFNSNYEYEIIRLCTNQKYKVYGAASKLFKYFVENYHPKSVLTYVDISKFSGGTYTKLGFTASIDSITEPNYTWVNSQFKVLSRYQTQKQKLLENKLGTPDETEDEIMSSLGYYKIYNSGNLKLEWIN